MDVLRLVYPHIGWNFHVNKALYLYDHFERFLIVSPKSLDQLKLGSQQFLMWIFWTYNLFFIKFTMMPNVHGSQSSVQTLEYFFSNALLCVWHSKVHECGKIGCGAKYGIWKTWNNFLDLDVHEDEITNSVEQLDLMVCMFAQPFYIVDIFFMMMSQ